MYWYCYDIEDICRLFKSCNLHPQTVRQWIKNGLLTIDNGKPSLIYGNQLIDFLGKLNKSNKCKTDFEQMFCFKCRDGKIPYRKQIQLEQSHGLVKAKARCQTCKTLMNKNYKMDDVPRLRLIFNVGDVLELYDSGDSPANTHIITSTESSTNKPKQWELFPL